MPTKITTPKRFRRGVEFWGVPPIITPKPLKKNPGGRTFGVLNPPKSKEGYFWGAAPPAPLTPFYLPQYLHRELRFPLCPTELGECLCSKPPQLNLEGSHDPPHPPFWGAPPQIKKLGGGGVTTLRRKNKDATRGGAAVPPFWGV